MLAHVRNKWFVNFVLNIFAVRNSSLVVQQSAKFIPKQLAYHKMKTQEKA